jgi:hypothetical protein
MFAVLGFLFYLVRLFCQVVVLYCCFLVFLAGNPFEVSEREGAC